MRVRSVRWGYMLASLSLALAACTSNGDAATSDASTDAGCEGLEAGTITISCDNMIADAGYCTGFPKFGPPADAALLTPVGCDYAILGYGSCNLGTAPGCCPQTCTCEPAGFLHDDAGPTWGCPL